MKVVILCGGEGRRISAHGDDTPKVLFEIGGRPILWHIMKIFGVQGFDDFVLCLGHGASAVRSYFAPDAHPVDVVRCEDKTEGWKIALVDTGEHTNTGGRICRVAGEVSGERFIATYGDGVADVDLRALVAFHEAHGKTATITAVRPWSQFGILQLGEDSVVRRFREKPRLRSWINGGFFVFEPSVFGYLGGDTVLEDGPFRALAEHGEMMAYRHDGFWACMDTYKDLQTLNDLWTNGRAAWRTW